ncbi:hypothetical protein LIER_32744 [Lithospermum erythrorhizon]|uniref:Uncharacterized protein n=1 Tax=Lithospermum erythrorhizon TaxID=34254 RepID=A0AAV3S0K1_LITER
MGVIFTDEVQCLVLFQDRGKHYVSLSTSSPDGRIKKEAVSNDILIDDLRRGTRASFMLSLTKLSSTSIRREILVKLGWATMECLRSWQLEIFA